VNFEENTAKAETLQTVSICNAIWMVPGADRKTLYVTCDEGIVAYRIRPDGTLVEISRLLLEGLTAPCHASVSPDGTRLAWAEYRNAVVGLVELAPDGSFVADSLKTVHHEGRGFSSPRQDSAHAHCVAFSPDGKYLFAVDLGIDEVKAYDPVSLKDIPEKNLRVAPGSGPRHLVFHPSGKAAALGFELGNRIALYRYEDGVFVEMSSLSTLPEGFSDHSQTAAVKFSDDGKELYVSNRGHDSLAVFSADAAAGTLSLRGILPLDGSFPRDFAFSPGGTMLTACLKKSGIVRTFAYDREACLISPIAEMSALHSPLFVLYAPWLRGTDGGMV
jgi:6-phosphogluconolactonase